MCLIVFAYKAHPDYRLILAANRDEFYERPASVADWWANHPGILAGRDLKANGTWMGVDKKGRFAAVTNYRDLSSIRDNARSRGDLPVDFLTANHLSAAYGGFVLKKADQYNGFNLLTMDEEMVHLSNYENKVNLLTGGIYGLSNALLNTSWPKVDHAKRALEEEIKGNFSLESLVAMMQDDQVAPDNQLPATGLSLEMERAVSAMCIRTPDYGTCCSTAITIDHDGNVAFLEKSYPVGNRKDISVSYAFKTKK